MPRLGNTRTSMPWSTACCATWRWPRHRHSARSATSRGSRDRRARRAAHSLGAAGPNTAENPWHRTGINPRHPGSPRHGTLPPSSAPLRSANVVLRSNGGARCAQFPQPRRGAANAAATRHSVVPTPRTTEAICRCTRNGATALRRSRRSSRPAWRGVRYAAVTDHSMV